MVQLSPIILVSTLLAGTSIAQQYPLPVTYDRVFKSPVNPAITISYKQPDSKICAIAYKNQKQYSGYVNLLPIALAPYQQNYSINTFFWFIEAHNNPETAPLTIWLNNFIGGQVRQYGNLSFSRVYDAGHQVPYYQPETAFAVFTRIIQDDDIGTGRSADLRTFGTKGPSASQHQNTIPPQPASFCWIRKQDTCKPDQVAVITAGNGTVEADVWYPAAPSCTKDRTKPSKAASKSQPRDVDKSEPTTALQEITSVYTATSTPTEKKTSGASIPSNPFRLLRREVAAGGSTMDRARAKERKIRNGLIGGLAATAALLLGLISYLCCCRCCRSRRPLTSPYFEDTAEKGPIVISQVFEEEPVLPPQPRDQPAVMVPMEPIPEVSTPSDDNQSFATAPTSSTTSSDQGLLDHGLLTPITEESVRPSEDLISLPPAPRVPFPRVPSPQVPSPQVPSPQVLSPQVLSPQVPFPQVPSPQVPSPQVPSLQVPSPQIPPPQIPLPRSLPKPFTPPVRDDTPMETPLPASPIPQPVSLFSRIKAWCWGDNDEDDEVEAQVDGAAGARKKEKGERVRDWFV